MNVISYPTARTKRSNFGMWGKCPLLLKGIVFALRPFITFTSFSCEELHLQCWSPYLLYIFLRLSIACSCSRQPRFFDWDYRWMSFPLEARHCKHPNDQSLATYRGHSVLRTLIRCYFSPVYRLEPKMDYFSHTHSSLFLTILAKLYFTLSAPSCTYC